MDISPSKCLTFLPTGLLCPDSVPVSSDCDCVFSVGRILCANTWNSSQKLPDENATERGRWPPIWTNCPLNVPIRCAQYRPPRCLPTRHRDPRSSQTPHASVRFFAAFGCPSTPNGSTRTKRGGPRREAGATPLLCPRFLSAMRSKPLRAPSSGQQQRRRGGSSCTHMRIGCAHADRLFTCG